MVQTEDAPDAKRARVEEHDDTEEADLPDEEPSAQGDQFSGVSVHQLMSLYYGRIFPYDEIYRWLAYGNDSKHAQADPGFFHRREFCFTLDRDIFVRYQSFKNGEELQKAIMRKLPAKIDLGPVYTVDPQRRNAYAGAERSAVSDRVFAPVERELVFDIDLTDYDDVRTCGKEGHICNKCWPLMAVAVDVLDRGLRQDFGFKHVLWVFSGRRGIHCWVCDRKARLLTDEQRSALAAYFSIYKGQENGMAKLMLGLSSNSHPAVDQAIAHIREAWTEAILPQQGLLDSADRWQGVLRYFGDDEIAHRLHSRWAGQSTRDVDAMTSIQRWTELEAEVAKISKQKDVRRTQNLQRAVKEILLAYAYPRLDVEVSKKMNHLLKAPFCVHPKTGKVCVPVDPGVIWDFDPEAVPTVAQLLRELNVAGGPAASQQWSQTSMAPSMHYFNSQFLQPLVADSHRCLSEKARAAATQPSLAW